MGLLTEFVLVQTFNNTFQSLISYILKEKNHNILLYARVIT